MAVARRTLLAAAFGSAATSVAAPALARVIGKFERSLSFESLHTGERLKTIYWANGVYLPDAARDIAQVLRDRRNQAIHPIEPGLLDLLHALTQKLDTSASLLVICGYRSPESNSAMASLNNGVVRNSLHTRGMAIDIRIPGVELTHLRDAAKSLAGGGVGYYPKSDFVHVDNGRVRSW